MGSKNFKDYAIAGNNVTLTYDDINDTVTFDADGGVTSINGETGIVILDKSDIGLENVDNTSDANKPISTATQSALNDKASTTSLNAHTSDTNNPHAVTKTQVGLGNVDNTSDANKPISTATQTALNGKQDTLVSGTNIKTVNSNSLVGSGDVVIDKTSIGLGNVTNVDTTNASNISSGTLSDSRLSANVTTQGNTFNVANKLVQLDASAKLPAVDGSQLTNLPSFTPPNGLLKIASAISTTFQAVTDYLGNVSVLFLNSRRVGIGKDTSVTTQSVAVVEVQDANTSIVLKPNGTGGIIATIPDGTTAGGNARGPYSIELMPHRVGTAATAVASGWYTTLIGGQRNTAGADFAVVTGGNTNTNTSNNGVICGGQGNTASTNTHATVVGGQSNTSSGQYSVSGGTANTAAGSRSIAFGDSNNASAYGAVCIGLYNAGSGQYSFSIGLRSTSYLESQFSLASDRFSAAGDAQQSLLTARKLDTLTTAATTTLSLDGTGTSKLIIPNGNNRAWNVQIDTIAVVTAITGTATGVSVGDCYRETKQLLFKRIGGTSSIVGTVDTTAIKSDTSMSTAALTVTAGASQQMALTFTAPTFAGGGSVTCRVVSKVSLVECAY